MHRKLDSLKFLSLLLVIYVTLLVTYMKLGVGGEFLYIIEDFLLPIGAFSLGIKFEKRKVFWLLIFIFIGVLSRIIGHGDIYEILTTAVILLGYIAGGYHYRVKNEKKVLFSLIALINLAILSVPDISVPIYNEVMVLKDHLHEMISPLTGISFTVSRWIISGFEYWSYALEIVEKLLIGFFVVRVHNIFARRLDFSLDLSYFNRRFGMIILEAFMIVLLLKSLGYNGMMQYSIAIFSLYFFVTGAVEVFAIAKVAKVLRGSLLKRYLPFIWLFALVFLPFEGKFITVMATIIYSAYVATMGRHNMIRLLNDTIKRIKGV